MEPDFFKYLPSEIITNILLRLSVRSIAISKCVCKPWLRLLETDDFVKSHFSKSAPALALTMGTRDSNWFKVFELEDEVNLDRRYDPLTRFDFPYDARLGGSANGLVFLFDQDYRNNFVYVCNPITREFFLLRCPRAETYGFGATKISGQHKLVSIDPRCLGEANRRFQCNVYTLGTGSWRRVEATDSFDWSPVTVGTFANGNIHWMVTSDPECIERISCFDLETECFSSFTVPPLRRSKLSRRLYTLRDSLGFCDESSDDGGVVIWMMKEYGVEKSWTKEYVIQLNLGPSPHHDIDEFQLLHPIKVFKNGDVLFWACKMFMYYSNKTKTNQEIGGFFGAGEEFDYITSLLVTPSMVSLKSFGGMENVISF